MKALATQFDDNSLIGPLCHLIRTAVPDFDCAGSVFPLWDCAFKTGELKRVILHLNGQPFFSLLLRQPLGHGPAFQHPSPFKPEVIVQSARFVFLDDEASWAWASRYGLVFVHCPPCPLS